jgi:hypothetical protein
VVCKHAKKKHWGNVSVYTVSDEACRIWQLLFVYVDSNHKCLSEEEYSSHEEAIEAAKLWGIKNSKQQGLSN